MPLGSSSDAPVMSPGPRVRHSRGLLGPTTGLWVSSGATVKAWYLSAKSCWSVRPVIARWSRLRFFAVQIEHEGAVVGVPVLRAQAWGPCIGSARAQRLPIELIHRCRIGGLRTRCERRYRALPVGRWSASRD